MTIDPVAPPAPRKGSTVAVLVFVAASLALPCGLLGYHFIAWYAGQIALASISLNFLAWADKLSLVVQGFVSLALFGLLAFASHDPRFRPIYRTWLIASLLAFPTIILHFLSWHQNQLGAIIQIAFAAALAIIARLTLGGTGVQPSHHPQGLVLNALPRPVRAVPIAAALIAGAIALYPFIALGALGSLGDTVLNLAAALALGLLAALLLSPTADNFLLNGLGFGVTLALLGSTLGFGGNQLFLLAILPSFAFAAMALAQTPLAAGLLVGLAAAGPLLFFDPSELTILLGGNEIISWAERAGLIVVAIGFAVGAGLWVARRVQGRTALPRAVPLGAAIAAWIGAVALFFTMGRPGFYGEKLFVILKDQADVSAAAKIADRTDRLTAVYTTLTDHANITQAGLRHTLDTLHIHYTPYYLVNALEVDGGPLLRLYLAARSDVDRVLDSPHLRPLPQPVPVSPGPDSVSPENPGWNIKMIGAGRVWTEFGVTGQGIVVGQSDSGVDGSHPALSDGYRGRTSGDDYNWYDPWDGTRSPNDEGGHGTHTLGTILGGRGIGVAPGAQWMACVNLNRNLGNPALYLDCMQFMLAPFPQHGDPFKDGKPSLAAHVLNDSWGCPPIEGCDSDPLRPAVDALRAAGIFVVASAGNDGPNCNTIADPISLYDSAFSVGAVDSTGNIASFSSRGPVTADGSGRIKPDIVAPGVDVVSSLPNNTYGPLSGTSMAGPHVVGVVALMWSANPTLIGDIDRTEQILRDTATLYTGSGAIGCFGDNGRDAIGSGIVDAYAAVKLALGK